GIVAALLIIFLLLWVAFSLQKPTGGVAWEFISAQYDWNNMLKFWGIVWVFGLVVLLVCAYWPRRDNDLPRDNDLSDDTPKLRQLRIQRVRRSQIERLHSKLLVTFVVSAVILLFAGFGHELVANMRHPPDDSWFAKAMAKGGGWVALLASLGGSIH